MCDTFVALPPTAAGGAVIFGKNSDREPNEAQSLEYHPPREHVPGSRLKCTYLEIPQVPATRGVLISRPFWMWGAEMGANDRGLVIGNEAVWTRMPINKKIGLTGMDLLRLALERADTADQALETMVRLLADHGQGGICGYEDKSMAYHNSFIMADPSGAWVLETAGPLWAALRVKQDYAISNGLTIGEKVDEAHPDIIETARRKGWLKKGETFNFARVYSDWFFTTFSSCARRRGRSLALLEEHHGRLDAAAAMDMLRDHGDEDYRPDSHLLGNRVCAHATNKLTRNATQSTGSLVAVLKPDEKTFWATGTAAPCLSVFKPIWFEGRVLPDLGPIPGKGFDARSLWWRHEMLHRSVLLDFQFRGEVFRRERDALEQSFMEMADQAGPDQRPALTEAAFRQAVEAADKWTHRVQGLPVRHPGRPRYRRYWRRQNDRAALTVR